MSHWSQYTQENSFRDHNDRQQLKRAAGESEHGSGLHMPTGVWDFAVAFILAMVVWFVAPLVNLPPLWAIPALLLYIFVRPLLRAHKAAARTGKTARRTRHPVLLHTTCWTIVLTTLGIWFAVSEGDISLARAGITSAGIGAVFGLIAGLIVRFVRRKRAS